MSGLWTTGYALAFFVLCALVMRALGRRGPLAGSVGAVLLGWLFFDVAFPGLQVGSFTVPGMAMLATGSETPLPVPAFAFWTYIAHIVAGALVVVSASDEALSETTAPIGRLLRGVDGAGRGARLARVAVLYLAVPLLAAWAAFGAFAPDMAAPIEARQAHPSIAYDEHLENPLRHPTAEMLAALAEAEDLGDASEDELRARFVEVRTHEGRHLYAKNCSPCHGGKADGTGPAARALRLAPADFTDPGTIATLVEGYAFRRVTDGGIGLPAAGAPWDSAMPRWKGELTDEEIFRVLMAEYDLAGVSPRVPEELE